MKPAFIHLPLQLFAKITVDNNRHKLLLQIAILDVNDFTIHSRSKFNICA